MTKIIAFAGRKQSGKTTCSEFVVNCCSGPFLGTPQIYNFADPLKTDICMNILGLSYDQCYGSDENKNTFTDCYWQDVRLTAREVMQFVGTDLFRKMKNDVWASATINKIKLEEPKLAIIADCRFPNEVEVIQNAGGLVIKLTRNPYSSNHDSETALDPERYPTEKFDLVIENDHMTIGEQNKIIHQYLIDKGILSL
jgi:hypothetical protein